jgi:ABC-2 type transport system ATP-binding protein
VLADVSQAEGAVRAMAGVALGEVQVEDRTVTAAVTGGASALRRVLGELEESGIDVLDIGLRRPTLDDVFLTLTGHVTEDDKPTDQEVSA